MTLTKPNGTAPPPSLTGWQARAVHTITCPSGQRLQIRIPGIATLLEHGDMPDELVELAFDELTKTDGAAGATLKAVQEIDDREAALERITRFADFQRQLVCCSVVAVEQDGDWSPVTLSPDDLDSLPEDDIGLVAAIVQRQRGTDARGVRIGVEPIDRWRRFHEHHGLDPEGCQACEAFLDELSTADVGAV